MPLVFGSLCRRRCVPEFALETNSSSATIISVIGSHLAPVYRYLVQSERCPDQYLACLLLFQPGMDDGAARFLIGWNHEIRKAQLPYVVCNSRFLILPWVTVRDLASKILSLAASRLLRWECVYGYSSLLLETQVDPSAPRNLLPSANWIHIGKPRDAAGWMRAHRFTADRSRYLCYSPVPEWPQTPSSSRPPRTSLTCRSAGASMRYDPGDRMPDVRAVRMSFTGLVLRRRGRALALDAEPVPQGDGPQ